MKGQLLVFLFLPLFYLAQIKTDRPGEGTASDVVSPETIQLESGVVYHKDENGFTSDHLLRFGITEKWEVRLQTNQDLSDSSESTYDFSSKYKFLAGENFSPSLALIADSDFQFKDYSFTLASDKKLTENLGSSAGIAYLKENLLHYFFFSFGLDYTFEDDRWAIFGEYFGYYNSMLSPEHGSDFGITFLASPNLQLDVSFGSNLQNISNQYFLSTGISYQFR